MIRTTPEQLCCQFSLPEAMKELGDPSGHCKFLKKTKGLALPSAAEVVGLETEISRSFGAGYNW